MSVYFLGDPHLDHRNIATFRPFVADCQDNTDKIVMDWKLRINKRATVYIMGDASFTDEGLDILSRLPGKKILIKGNHDDMVTTLAQTDVFAEIHGMLKYKAMWLTHAPMHPDELRGKPNVHGHVHQKSIMRRNWYGRKVLDRRYLNTCVDVVYPGQITGRRYATFFLSLDDVKSYFGRKTSRDSG